VEQGKGKGKGKGGLAFSPYSRVKRKRLTIYLGVRAARASEGLLRRVELPSQSLETMSGPLS